MLIIHVYMDQEEKQQDSHLGCFFTEICASRETNANITVGALIQREVNLETDVNIQLKEHVGHRITFQTD